MTNEPTTEVTTVTGAVVERPAIRSLILSGVDLASYQTTVLREAQQRLGTRERGVEMCEQQISEAKRGLEAAEYADLWWQIQMYRNLLDRRQRVLKRRQRDVENARKFLSLVNDGYLPIPRIPAIEVHWLHDPMPPEVLEVLGGEMVDPEKRFSKFVVATGEEADARFRPARFSRPVIAPQTRHRDPILLGICDGEMFPLAWWR